jgi:MFS superfamily sulfate permease-like transporter
MTANSAKSRGNLVADLIAGLTTGVANIPDAMASSILAGANPVQGLYAIMIGTPLGTFLGSSAFMNVAATSALAIIALTQGAGVSKAYSNPDGNYPDSSRSFVGQGAANIGAGLFSGMPIGGSVSGTALNISSGAKSRWANVFSGLLAVLAVPLFSRAVSLVAMRAPGGDPPVARPGGHRQHLRHGSGALPAATQSVRRQAHGRGESEGEAATGSHGNRQRSPGR